MQYTYGDTDDVYVDPGSSTVSITGVDAGSFTDKFSVGQGSATVAIADVYQSNGVIHVVDKVLLPN